MIAPACKHESVKKFGHDRHGNQRFRCLLCGLTWIEDRPKPLGELRIAKDRAVLCLRLLLEGNSIRSTERITRLSRNAILRLLETVGRRALRFWGERMNNLPVANVQVDEIWGYVGMKEKTRMRVCGPTDYGDTYCHTAIKRDSKLLVVWHLGKRSPRDTEWFCDKLRRVTVVDRIVEREAGNAPDQPRRNLLHDKPTFHALQIPDQFPVVATVHRADETVDDRERQPECCLNGASA
jgi:transposase-like protein